MMRYARISGAGNPLVIETGPIAATPVNGVLVKTLYGGVCHSDVHFIQDEMPIGDGEVARVRDIIGDEEFKKIVPGHEIIGFIESIGTAALNCNLAVGDRVIVYPWKGCGTCVVCLKGDTNLCPQNRGSTTEQGQNPEAPGGYCSYVPVHNWKHAIKVPDSIPSEVACTLPCAALTAFQALRKCRDSIEHGFKVSGKTRLLILGVGGLGTWCLGLALYVYSKSNIDVIVGDIDERKILAAKEAGAGDGIFWKKSEDAKDVTNKLTENGLRMVDACIDFVGSKMTNSIGIHSLQKGGTLVCVGLAAGVMECAIPILISREIRVQGMRVAPVQVLEELVHLVQKTKIKSPETEIVKLDDINNTLDRLAAGKISGRAIVKHE